MSEQEKLERGKRRTKRLMITITVAFLVLMLVIPLASVIASSLKEGIGFYLESISTEYVRSALGVTILATVIAVIVNTFFGICAAWLLTKFSFRGKQVLATLIDIPFSISPVIVGLAYLMTFGRLGWFYPAIRSKPMAWNGHPHHICNSGCRAGDDFCYFPICIEGTDPDSQCAGKGRRRGGGADGSERI